MVFPAQVWLPKAVFEGKRAGGGAMGIPSFFK